MSYPADVSVRRRQVLGTAVDLAADFGNNRGDIAGTVASMTEGDPGVASEKTSHNAPGLPREIIWHYATAKPHSVAI